MGTSISVPASEQRGAKQRQIAFLGGCLGRGQEYLKRTLQVVYGRWPKLLLHLFDRRMLKHIFRVLK